jgi:hypothetical protein
MIFNKIIEGRQQMLTKKDMLQFRIFENITPEELDAILDISVEESDFAGQCQS